MGSSIWLLQTWWNFHFYYAIPLILYFIHMFMDSGKWRYCLLAGNLLFIQAFGGLPYFLPVTSLVIFLYFLFYFLFSFNDSLQKIKLINFRWAFLFITSIILLLFIGLYLGMKFGTDQIYVANFMRTPDGSVPLDVFLTYGGKLSWQAWLEILLGISPALDYTLYIGIVCVPFIFLGLMFNLNKRNIHLYLTSIVLLLFSMGTFVSIVFYYCWPMMEYFRHLILVSPIIKVFLCFLAGFGLEAVFINCPDRKNVLSVKLFLALMTLLMMGTFFVLWTVANHYPYDYQFLYDQLEKMVPKQLPPFLATFRKNIMISRMGRTAIFAFAAMTLFAVLFVMKLNFSRIRIVRWQRYWPVLLGALLMFHCVDIYGFKFSEIQLKTVALNDEMYEMTEFQAMPYPKRRNASFTENNPRAKLLSILPLHCGVLYWTTHAFLFKDQLGNPFKTDSWLLPLDQYMRAYWGQSIHDLSIKPRGLFFRTRQESPRLEFPRKHLAALEISGVTEDRIQFFSQAEFIASEDIIAKNITDGAYNGDIIFLSPREGLNNICVDGSSEFSAEILSANKRLRLACQVQRFDSNNIIITTNTNNNPESVWLLYSDVWHPFWRATVNGKEMPVYKANLAYKAVKLENGFNEVHLYFKSDLMALFYWFVGLNSMIWLMIIIFLVGEITFRDAGRSRHAA